MRTNLPAYFFRQSPQRVIALGLLLFLYGLSEAFGMATLLPILNVLLQGGADSDNPLLRLYGQIASWLGVKPSLPLFLAIFIAVIVAKNIFGFGIGVLLGTICARVSMDLRLQLIGAMARASWRHIARYPKGFMTNALSSEASRIADAYNHLAQGTAFLITGIFYFVIILSLSWKVALLGGAVGVVMLLIMRQLIKAIRRAATDQTHSLREISRRITDVLPSLKPLKAMGDQSYLVPALEKDARRFRKAQVRQAIYERSLMHIQEPVIALTLSVGLWFVISNELLPVPTMLVLAAVLYRLLQTLRNFQERLPAIVAGETALESFMMHLNTADQSRERSGGRPMLASDCPPHIQLQNVSFGYEEELVLDSLSFEIPAGTLAVLQGPSGSGKTTICDLITGLFEPISGEVLIDGQALHETGLSDWRSAIGYVPQELVLFSDTIRGNIVLGHADIEERDVWHALEAASLADFVRSLPGGLETRIGELGAGLSGGQRQRLSLARALARRPRLLILDEPTTALDATSATIVCQTLVRLKGELTMVGISHQTALLDVADHIFRLEDGTIREVVAGSAPELARS